MKGTGWTVLRKKQNKGWNRSNIYN